MMPAMNLRALTYDMASAIFRSAKKINAGAFIFEIARSEMGYTDQKPLEYTTVCLAAAIREGYKGPVFIQGDHFQANAKKYKEDPKNAGELNRRLCQLCLDYLKDKGERYVYYTHIMNALNYTTTGGAYDHQKITNGKELKEKANWIIGRYRDSVNGTDLWEELCGTCICARHEFYWRMCRLYENTAIEKNGDVFPKNEIVLKTNSEILELSDKIKQLDLVISELENKICLLDSKNINKKIK